MSGAIWREKIPGIGMVWKWADRKQDEFPTFHHQDSRIESLEADFSALVTALLEAHYTELPVLAGRLRAILKHREDAPAEK